MDRGNFRNVEAFKSKEKEEKSSGKMAKGHEQIVHSKK